MDLAGVSDAELLAAVAHGDESALGELVARHSAWLLLRLRRRTADEDLAVSVVQDTYVAVWRSAGKFRGDGDVAAWLWGIAAHQLISKLRQRRGPVPLSSQLVSALSPAVRSAEDELLAGIEHGDLGAALRTLPPELVQVLQAMVIDGLSSREAAALLGLPQGTVKSRMRIAKSRLRQQLLPLEGWS